MAVHPTLAGHGHPTGPLQGGESCSIHEQRHSESSSAVKQKQINNTFYLLLF